VAVFTYLLLPGFGLVDFLDETAAGVPDDFLEELFDFLGDFDYFFGVIDYLPLDFLVYFPLFVFIEFLF